MGTFVRGTIEGRQLAAAAIVPPEALRESNRVWVVDGESRLQYRRVSVGQRIASGVVIDSGLSAGDRVIVSELEVAVEGMTVAVAPTPSNAGN